MNQSEAFWEDRKAKYPFQVEVLHRSSQDIDPAYFAKLTRHHFLRVPFNGVAHWGFEKEKTRDFFLKVSGVKP